MNTQLKRLWPFIAILLIAVPALVLAQTTYDGFTVAWELDPNTADNIMAREGYGGYSVKTGMDFDHDGRREILLTLDETLAPGGPDPGHIDVYLYENDGDDSYSYVWSFGSPELGNSQPGLAYGDIDEDGLYEIYFGIPPAVGSNDNTWGTYIFEQNIDGTFPAAPTLIYTHGYVATDNFRPAGYQLGDVDKDGDIELCAVDRGTRRMQILSLSTEGLDEFADFTIEFELGPDVLGGGGVYDLMIVDFDGDGFDEVWVNTWDLWSMAVVENTAADTYVLQLDLNQIFSQNNDPGSFNMHDLFFQDVDGDGLLEAWFPMTDGKLYFLDDATDVSAIVGTDVVEVLTFNELGHSRGADIGDIDSDGRPDIITGTGVDEEIIWIEYQEIGDPALASSYTVKTIYSLKDTELPDRFYSPAIAPVDLDGDGKKEVILSNIKASGVGQAAFTVLEFDPFTAPTLATNWSVDTQVMHADADSLFGVDYSGNSRTGIAGMDMDKDGKHEMILTDYAGARVIVFEYDAINGVFEEVWSSPEARSTSHDANNPRTVSVGDLDSDGKEEIVFPLAQTGFEGWHIYEWDGVTGSDNYGTTYSSICAVEVDTCCFADLTAFNADHEAMMIFDVDGDGQQELISAIRRNSGGKRGTLIMHVEDDIEHNAGGSGLETWVAEFFVDRVNYGGGSPYHCIPADLNGDGSYELVNHTWNYFNLFNIAATGTDTYSMAAVDSPTRYYQATYPSDHVSLFGGTSADIDGDGNDEVYLVNYNNAGLYVVDYDATDDVLVIDGNHVVKIADNVGNFYSTVFDVDQNGHQNIFVGAAYPKTITSTEFVGTDPRNPDDYVTSVIYSGEEDVIRDIVVTDSAGVMSTTYLHTSAFASKVQSNWNGMPLDFDGDDNYEIFASFQSNADSVHTTNYTWNATSSQWDTVETAVLNDKNWVAMLFEFAGGAVSVDEIVMITPDSYKLLPNYPNPFNPVTNIEFVLPIDKQVSLKVYNMLGQHVRTLVGNELRQAGHHQVQWNGMNEAGTPVASGVYIYSLEWGNFRKTQMMTLLK
ncbi:MAG: FG-GAP-like repeat-containing protein [Candidatus Neomarinimicrobiota bacterium]